MPQGLIDIKRRIRSASSTMQITKAMELVATSKLKKARERLDKSKPYFNTILNSISDVLTNTTDLRHPFIMQRPIKNSLYIIITSDKGLAGGYNAGVCKLLQNEIKDKQTAKIIAIGARGRNYFNRRGYNVIYEMTGISESPDSQSAIVIGEKAVKLYVDEEVDEIKIVYTAFKSTLSYVPTIINLLPAKFEKSKEVVDDDGFPILIRFEPSPEGVLNFLIPKYVNSVIYGSLVESSASENGSRRLAMESATDNAEEVINELALMKNRARQAVITQEISEIVGGAEALA